ncbi:hypothetical protein [Peribacillus simplex]|uniref:hypothetical protein n=1 Tax=Peribacillus TaxID=2675229 RepID=UPI0036DD2B0F
MKSQDTAAMLEILRNICLALPEAVEHIDGFGHNTFKINGKSFVISGEARKDSACRSSQIEKLKNYCCRTRIFSKPHI